MLTAMTTPQGRGSGRDCQVARAAGHQHFTPPFLGQVSGTMLQLGLTLQLGESAALTELLFIKRPK